METLRYRDMLDQLKEQHFEIPKNTIPGIVEIIPRDDGIGLIVDGREILLTIEGAKKLVFELRRTVEKMTKKNKRGKRK